MSRKAYRNQGQMQCAVWSVQDCGLDQADCHDPIRSSLPVAGTAKDRVRLQSTGCFVRFRDDIAPVPQTLQSKLRTVSMISGGPHTVGPMR
jgi:hypothetical protein